MENEQLILNELKQMRIDIEIIKENVLDDATLNEDDIQSIEIAESELKEGKTISHNQLKKELEF